MIARPLAAGLMLGLALVAPRAAQAADYELHAILPLTGNASFLGREQQDLLRILEPAINKGGGIAGRTLRFVFHDDQTSPQVALQLANEVLASHPEVAECAVIGAADALKGQVPVGFLVLKAGAAKSSATVAEETVKLVRDRIGPVASFKTAVVVDRLPKTRSGKILRGTMKKIADHDPWTIPATIDDAGVLDEIAAHLKGAGYAKNG